MKKYIFLDRDGVINKDPGGWTKHEYVTDPNDFHFLPGVLDAIRMLTDADFNIIVASNQAGVGKGHFTREMLDAVNGKMISSVEGEGGRIEAVYYCVHKKEDNCDCRKPRPGLFEKARRQYRIKFSNTYFIGDNKTDILAGKSAGLKTILVFSGKTSRDDVRTWIDKPNYSFTDLLEAVKWILAKDRRRSERAYQREIEEG